MDITETGNTKNCEKEWTRTDSGYGPLEGSFEVSMKHQCSRKLKGVFLLEMLDCRLSRNILIDGMWCFFMWVVKRRIGPVHTMKAYKGVGVKG